MKTFCCVLLGGCCALCSPLGVRVGLWGRNGMTRFGVTGVGRVTRRVPFVLVPC